MADKVNVKIIKTDHFEDLETEINAWLDKHDNEVVDIKFTKLIYDWGYNDVYSYFIAVIIYTH